MTDAILTADSKGDELLHLNNFLDLSPIKVLKIFSMESLFIITSSGNSVLSFLETRSYFSTIHCDSIHVFPHRLDAVKQYLIDQSKV